MAMRGIFIAALALFAMAAQSVQAAPGVLGVRLIDGGNAMVVAAQVDAVAPGSAAASAGLEPGDLVTAVDGHAVSSSRALQSYVRAHHAGDRLRLVVLRRTPDGFQTLKLTAVLAAPEGMQAAIPPVDLPEAAPPPANANNDAWHAAPAAPFQGRMADYIDPGEHAFAVKVPAGWRVGGRLVRYGPISIAPFVQALSPDGAIFVQLGDWHLQDFADLPGWAEGRLYTPGTSIEIVRRTQSAPRYAEDYARNFAKMLGCSDVALAGVDDVPEPAGLARMPNSRAETVVARFTCTRDGKPFQGQVMTTVQAARIVMMTSWNVIYLASVLAREDRAGQGIAAWNAMRQSFAFLPEWNAQESRIAGESTRPAMEGLEATMRQAATFDHEVLNGSATMQDPGTGARMDVPLGAAPFYFADGLGHTYNSYDPNPRPGFHALAKATQGQ